MSGDVTAVVLTTGEATTDEAIASLARQTMPLADVIVVRDIRPFHQAINFGARQVKTPYFLQLDADMILDDSCVAALRAAMGKTVGVAVGHLRDPLVGTIVGIKLYRTQCFLDLGFRDTISPDTRYIDELANAGWTTRYIGGREKAPADSWETFGDHRPAYSPGYTYRKYLMEGQRYRHRSAIGGFKGHLVRLEQSGHEMAFLAQVGLTRGFFRQGDFDPLGLIVEDDEFLRLQDFLETSAPPADPATPAPDQTPLGPAFASWFRLGKAIFDAHDGAAFRRYMHLLDHDPAGMQTWPLKLALCRGLLASSTDDETIERDFGPIRPHLPSTRGNSHEDTKAARLENMIDYARSARLSRFTLASPLGGEFRLATGGAAGFIRTDTVVSIRTDRKRRPRINLPLRPFGHVICPDPERLEGVAWCFDLVRAGYTVAHVPAAVGARTRNLPALLARGLFERMGGNRLYPEPRKRTLPDFMPLVEPRQPGYGVIDKRILMVTQSLGRGGSERQMIALIEGMARRHFDLRVISLSRLQDGEPSYEADLDALGVPVEYADERPAVDAIWATDRIDPGSAARLPPWLTDRVPPIVSAILRHQPAVVHSWLDAAGIAAGVAGCALGVPRTLIQQGSMAMVRRGNPASEAMRLAYLALSTNASITIVNNCNAGARDNEDWIGLPRDKIGLIYNGFVPASARVPAERDVLALRQALQLPEKEMVVGTVMRFVKEKDPALWIDTAATIAAARSDVRFLIFGFGPLEAMMRARIDRLGLGQRIVMAGAVTDVGLAYSAMDVVLMTSEIEGLPNVMIEAQAVGRPVVAPNVGGTREALIDGVTGTIVAKRSRHELANAVLAWLKGDTRRLQVETAGPEFVRNRFDLDRMVEDTLRFYTAAS